MNTTEAIEAFLKTVPINYAKDLTARCVGDMECQVMVDPSNGEAVYDGDKLIRNTWSVDSDDLGTYQFHHIRVPRNAMSEPYYNDTPLRFPLTRHVECIGMTGWNWKKKQSMWVAFDFDAITGHAAGVGVDDEALQEVQKAAAQIPWVQVRKSTGGAGLHLYVYFDPQDAPSVANHNIHAALARAVLGLMEREAGFDFRGNMDVLGGNMWIWHRKINEENHGLEIIKDYEDFCPRLPDNWMDNLNVVTGSASKIQFNGVDQSDHESFEAQASSRVKIDLDDIHKEIELRIHEMGYTIVWIPDYHCWQTHTKVFEKLLEEYPGEYQGIFKTLSDGSDPGKPNCLAGNTRVITRQGVKPISELAGSDHEILTSRGKWVTAPFKSYGDQEVFNITLKHGVNQKVIKATADHRWFTCVRKWNGKSKLNLGDRSEVLTKELEPDHILCTVQPQLSVTPSVVGIQHGLVWGDGTNGGSRISSSLSLFGDKDTDLLRFFQEHPQRQLTNSIGGTEVWNLPYHFKSLVPLSYDKPYLYGWLAGYFAADGCVDEKGICNLSSADLDAVQHVAQICAILGIRTSPIRKQTNTGFDKKSTYYKIGINRGDLTVDFFLLDKHKERTLSVDRHNHRYWRVVSVEPAGVEEVYCATVEDTGRFVLEDFILTGNCFAFPTPNGGLRITRFGRGAKEHDTWNQAANDWTWTYFNNIPNLMEAASTYGGMEDPDGKGWIFNDFADVEAVCKSLGTELPLDKEWLSAHGDTVDRNILMRPNKNQQLVLEMDKKKDDIKPKGWIEKGRKYICLQRKTTTEQHLDDEDNFDDRVRALVDVSNEFSQWVLRNDDGEWVGHNKDNTRSALRVHAPDQVEDILGALIIKNWKLVNVPFQPEYLGNRRWNRHAPQFAFAPGERTGEHDNWERILDHCGQDLDEALKEDQWSREAGIHTGADYLRYWLAFMLRDPFCKLPYLFFYGPQNSGKSTFHEAAALLMTRGCCYADEALKSKSNFNGELAGSVLCVVEETNLSLSGSLAYDRMKAWVTGEEMLIHAKYQQPYQLRNTTHWCQTANDMSYVPIFAGDTRVVMMYVPMLDGAEIPRDTLFGRLKKEAPAFLRSLLDLKLPAPPGRLRLPTLETDSKREAEGSVESMVVKFIQEECHEIDGAFIKLKDFYETFRKWLPEDAVYAWSYNKVVAQLRERDLIPFGRFDNNVMCLGNISLEPKVKQQYYGEPLVRHRQRLVRTLSQE